MFLELGINTPYLAHSSLIGDLEQVWFETMFFWNRFGSKLCSFGTGLVRNYVLLEQGSLGTRLSFSMDKVLFGKDHGSFGTSATRLIFLGTR